MERIASQRADRQNRFVSAGVDVFAGRWMAATVVILMLVVGVGLYGWWKGIRPESLAALGYPGVFLTMLISGAGTFMPFPGQATILAAGRCGIPFWSAWRRGWAIPPVSFSVTPLAGRAPRLSRGASACTCGGYCSRGWRATDFSPS